jgi:hypothetical protein
MAADEADDGTLDAATDWDGGVSWIARPDEDAQRASHALATDAGVWVVDPVDAPGLDERLRALGEVAGVAVIQDRHTRDAAAVARRHDAPLAAPEPAPLTREKLDRDAEPLAAALDGTGYAVCELRRDDEWEEVALWNAATGTLVVPEALGTLPAFTGGDAPVGLHPAVAEPPAALADLAPDRLLVGHGTSLHEGAGAALAALYDGD